VGEAILRLQYLQHLVAKQEARGATHEYQLNVLKPWAEASHGATSDRLVRVTATQPVCAASYSLCVRQSLCGMRTCACLTPCPRTLLGLIAEGEGLHQADAAAVAGAGASDAGRSG
jgi:hypothetical protein